MHSADGVIPTPLWIVLFFISVIVFAYMLFFADPSEGAVSQAMLMGAVTSVLTVLLLLLVTLNRPYQSGVGGVEPVAMERSLDTISKALTAIDARVLDPLQRGRSRNGPVTEGSGIDRRLELIATMLQSSSASWAWMRRISGRSAGSTRP